MLKENIESMPDPISYDTQILLIRLKRCFSYLELFGLDTTLENFEVLTNSLRTLEDSCPKDVRESIKDKKTDFSDSLGTISDENVEKMGIDFCRLWLVAIKDSLESHGFLRRVKKKGVGRLE